MASIRKNSVFVALQGTIGKELVFKHYTDKIVVAKYPDMTGIKPSELQKLQRSKMKEANAYARNAMRDPELRAQYEKDLQKGETLYHKAKKDFFNKKKE